MFPLGLSMGCGLFVRQRGPEGVMPGYGFGLSRLVRSGTSWTSCCPGVGMEW